MLYDAQAPCNTPKGLTVTDENAIIDNALWNIPADLKPIEVRFFQLLVLNSNLKKALEFIDMKEVLVDDSNSRSSSGSSDMKENNSVRSMDDLRIGSLVARYRSLMLEGQKQHWLEDALQQSERQAAEQEQQSQRSGGGFGRGGFGSGNSNNRHTPMLTIARFRVWERVERGETDSQAQWTAFGCAFRLLHTLPISHLCRSSPLYKVKFEGEYSVDAGGPYR